VTPEDPAALSRGRPARVHGPPVLHDGDVPVFWACGVTPQAAVVAAALPFAIGHAPGRMLITDAADTDRADGAPG
jgi:uncharacterized protein YcsI (UPF0317 family)